MVGVKTVFAQALGFNSYRVLFGFQFTFKIQPLVKTSSTFTSMKTAFN